MPILQPYPYASIWDWLDANAEELARMAGVSERQGVKAALRDIAKATESNWDAMMQILGTLSGSRLLQLFTHNPAVFSDIAKIALRHTNAAFWALNADALSVLMKINPEELKKMFSDVIGAASKPAMPAAVDAALYSLSNGNLATMLVEKPEVFIGALGRIIEVSDEFSPSVFSAVSDENLSAVFADDPDIVLNAYSEAAKVSNREAAAIFVLALKKQGLFRLFKKDPIGLVGSFTDLAKACGLNSAGLFYLLRSQRVAYMLEMNPESFISSLRDFVDAAGKAAGEAIPVLFDPRVEERLIGDAVALGRSFNALVAATGKGAAKAITLLKAEQMLTVFLNKPELLTRVFSSMAEASGEHADAAFGFLANPRITDMLGRETGNMVRRINAISASCGDSAPIVFRFLGREKVAEYFEQDPERITDFFSTVGKATGEGRDAAFELFDYLKFVQGFEQWPTEVMENLKKIANSAGSYAGDLFKLLSKERFAQAITELVSGGHLATCLVNLVNRSGRDTPMVLRLFENDEFAKRFIADPYKEEQIFNHLRSFACNTLPTGLEVLNDPEIAPVFAADPSVLVTTRFRGYVNSATAIPGVTAYDAMEAILKDRKVKELFIRHVGQEFEGEGHDVLENELLPALRAYAEEKKEG